MIHYKNSEQIELMRLSSQLVSKTLGMLAAEIRPGAIPLKLDKMAEEFIRDHGGEPGFLGLYNFPNTLNFSVNQTVVHGIPTTKPLEEGDIAGVDCGVKMNGYYGDHAYTFEVGEVSADVRRLLKVTKECLYIGIEHFRAGKRLGDLSYAIQNHAETNGYGVVRELVGHGLGKNMHEDPQVPNYGRRGKGKKFKNGLVLAIEPMINMGTHRVKQLNDGWTVNTVDNLPSAHYEHNVALVNGEPEILSTFDYVYEALGIMEPAL